MHPIVLATGAPGQEDFVLVQYSYSASLTKCGLLPLPTCDSVVNGSANVDPKHAGFDVNTNVVGGLILNSTIYLALMRQSQGSYELSVGVYDAKKNTTQITGLEYVIAGQLKGFLSSSAVELAVSGPGILVHFLSGNEELIFVADDCYGRGTLNANGSCTCESSSAWIDGKRTPLDPESCGLLTPSNPAKACSWAFEGKDCKAIKWWIWLVVGGSLLLIVIVIVLVVKRNSICGKQKGYAAID
jgi:hypothetical protein